VDTYFQAPRRRLKLREVSEPGQPARAVLIGYARATVTGARESAYEMVEIPDGVTLIALLEATLGIHARVTKVRDVLLVRHTRIHLDTVDQLGTFVELETLIGDPDSRRGGAGGALSAQEAERELAEIAAALELDAHSGLAGSYADLIEE
jgi:adenylate cyclase class 2